jgi:ribosomal protein S18 acetylase RimI-like enzyme
VNPGFDAGLLARVEDAGINASAPREQLWIDGWLVRFCPGKAKRARCIQAVSAGRLSIDEKLARCLAVFASAGLAPYVRITPFSQPPQIDELVAARGMTRIDDSRVMVAALPLGGVGEAAGRAQEEALAPGLRFEEVDPARFAEWVGQQRGSSSTERRAHADRLRQSPVPYRALLAHGADGNILAGGQLASEADLAGLYDIFTAEPARGRGVGRRLCQALLRLAQDRGASTAYLQVDAANEAAMRLYRSLGFEDAYGYHYRTPPTG